MAGLGAHGSRIGFVWRIEMVRALDAVPPPRLPHGYAFANFEAAQVPALAEIEHLAFFGSSDARAFADQLATPSHSLRAWERALWQGRVDRQATVVLVKAGAPCGFAQAFVARGVGYLNSVAVLPEHRGGTGRALVLEGLRRFRARGLRLGALTVTAENGRALALYERLGFQEVGWSIATYVAPG